MNASTVPFELAIERRIDASPASVTRGPGGPGGEEHASEGVILETVPNERILFTDAFAAGRLPRTAFVIGCFESRADGDATAYRASARYRDEASCRRHEEVRFRDGRAEVARQLAELAEGEGA